MKISIIPSVFLATLFLFQGASSNAMEESKQESEKLDLESNKVLIVYFSKSGNTKQVAEYIQKKSGGEISEIKVKDPYPEDYDETTKRAKEEIDNDVKPEIEVDTKALKDANIVFLGSPCWYGNIALPVITFLTNNDLSEKIICPFITHGGSGMGEKTLETIKSLCPNSKVLDGKAFGDPKWVSSSTDLKQEVFDWIDSLK